MSVTTQTESGQKIADLLAKAEQLKEEGWKKLSESKIYYDKIASLAAQESNNCAGYEGETPVHQPTSHQNSPPSHGEPTKKKAAKKSTFSPPNASSPEGHRKKVTLPMAICNVLNDRDSWKKIGVASDARGLTAGEIKKLIFEAGEWSSTSEDPSNQISGQIGKLKASKHVGRGEGRRYYIIEGSDLDS